ncbi:threonine ammonia-lyase [Inquilinus limosus]|uniref:Pyridoxal-5'-phosphate-dependent protein n=1 Tax=Inquilinus limosus TaxID=171674 RepID=A0A211ZR48_9PROT|nr:threonine/serine dehydratase [Inquilinus limosus]OWJ67666.1 pyridoxal-5'-phosphate-dependent protein [Inquilinus limosus]
MIVSVTDIEAAAGRLRGQAVRTPLLRSPLLDTRAGREVLVKAEPLQRTGSFKFRGAYNRISLIPEAERARGVVAFSSGNHAQGVAAAAKLFGIKATIVMPSDAPTIKRRNTESYGATVVPYDRFGEDREAVAAKIQAETGATLVRPYDDPGIIAGQGTIGLEIAEQCAELGVHPDAVLVGCSGGGLVSGVSVAIKAKLPGTRIYSAEPEALDDMRRSLAAGERVKNAPDARSICDALQSPTPGEITFSIARETLAGGVAAPDDAVLRAMGVAFDTLKLVMEPGGAIGLAATLENRIPDDIRTVVIVCSGGNVDAATFRDALATL